MSTPCAMPFTCLFPPSGHFFSARAAGNAIHMDRVTSELLIACLCPRAMLASLALTWVQTARTCGYGKGVRVFRFRESPSTRRSAAMRAFLSRIGDGWHRKGKGKLRISISPPLFRCPLLDMLVNLAQLCVLPNLARVNANGRGPSAAGQVATRVSIEHLYSSNWVVGHLTSRAMRVHANPCGVNNAR